MTEQQTTAAMPIKFKTDFIDALNTGKAAALANLVPGAILWAFLLSLVISYYTIDSVQGVLQHVEQIKLKHGYGYSFVMTGLFGGLVPFLIQKVMPDTRKETLWIHLPFFCLFWGYKGMEFDTLYRLQAWLFGDSKAFLTVLTKVSLDQLVYGPLWAAPSMIIAYYWKDHNYSLRRGLSFSAGYRWKNLFPVLLSNWIVWIPTVAMLYCLPLALQLPVQNVVLCFWVLLFTFIAKKKTADTQKSAHPQQEPTPQ